MKLLFLGDIVGRPGREALEKHLRRFRDFHEIDFVIANGENAAAGAGITSSIARKIKDLGVDAITLGDHVWDQAGFSQEIDQLEWVCRPANLPKVCPGKPYTVIESNGIRLGVFTVLGRVFMKIAADSPLEAAEAILEEHGDEADIWIAEIHAEATSEKVAMGYLLDGRVALVVGTHTHIPTADASLLPNGTAYLTDAGMTGPYRSILGREIQPILERMRDGMPKKFPVASEVVKICGCLVTLGESLRPTSIEPIKIPAESTPAGK